MSQEIDKCVDIDIRLYAKKDMPIKIHVLSAHSLLFGNDSWFPTHVGRSAFEMQEHESFVGKGGDSSYCLE